MKRMAALAPIDRRRPYIYCDHLQSEESLSSWIDRNAQRYGLARSGLFKTLGVRYQYAWDLDALDCWEARRPFFDSTGLSWAELSPNASPAPLRDWLLHPRARHGYCPHCFLSDLERGVTPYFRLRWSNVMLTHCAVHGVPLFSWHRVEYDGGRVLPNEWLTEPAPLMAKKHGGLMEDLRRIDTFKRDLNQHAPSREIWQTLLRFEQACMDFEGYAFARDDASRAVEDLGCACRLLVLAILRTYHRKRYRWLADELCPDFVRRDILNFDPTTVRRSLPEQAWRSSVRWLSDLPTRRAALWIVAHTFSSSSPRTRLRGGGYTPGGHTPGWLEAMSSAIGSREQIKEALHRGTSRHILEPRHRSSVGGPPPHFW